jgi:hypothetical protein
MDFLAVTSLIVALSTAIGYILHQLHLRNCECLCIKSDCTKRLDEPDTPPFISPVLLASVPLPTVEELQTDTKETEKSPILKRKVERIF